MKIGKQIVWVILWVGLAFIVFAVASQSSPVPNDVEECFDAPLCR